MKRVLALDFDGVLCDTLDECLITSINAYRKLNGSEARISSLKEVKPEWVERFRAIRPLVKPAGEYFVIAYWLHEEGGLMSGRRFDDLKRKFAATLDNYRSLFFEVRAELRSEDEQGWIELHKPFPQATEKLKELAERFEVCFVSNKDGASIEILSKHLGLDVPSSRMYTGEQGRSKPESIHEIVHQRNIAAKDVLFVDDQLDHLFDVEGTGAQCFWASWGYEKAPKREHSFRRLEGLGELL